jgi:hypothetical protein
VSGPAFTVPSGDPGAVSRAATQFGTLSGDHKSELTAFQGQVTTALGKWNGPIAERYATAAGDTVRRFNATVAALNAAQGALSAYAGALQAAQGAVGSLNRQVAAANGADAQKKAASSLGGQEASATGTLHQAAVTCAQALQSAQATLATSCPDTMTSAQFVQVVKNAEAKVDKGGKDGLTAYAGLEYMLNAYALFASSKDGRSAYQAGKTLAESKALVEALETKYTPAALKYINTYVDPDARSGVLQLWEQLRLKADKGLENAKDIEAEEGGTFIAGAIKAQTIGIAKAGAHAADADKAINIFARTSKLDLAVTGITIFFGIHDMIWPAGDTTWERDGNRAAGAAATFGGALALAGYAGALFGTTWEIPGFDLLTGTVASVMLIAAGLWAAGDAIYDYRHGIWTGIKDTGKGIWDGTKWVGNEFKDAGESIYHAPSNIAHGLEHLANPLDW